MEYRELGVDDLESRFDSALLWFDTTAQVSSEHEGVVQPRALDAIDFGLAMKDDGYNLYVAGPSGTGRTNTVHRAVEALARQESAPEDICYLHNFRVPDEPKALVLPAGYGCRFRDDMKELVEDIESEMQKAFLSEDYEQRRKEVLNRIEQERERFGAELQHLGEERGFAVRQSPTGVFIVPVLDGAPMSEEHYNHLPQLQKDDLQRAQGVLEQRVREESRRLEMLRREVKQQGRALDEDVARHAIGHLFDERKQKYGAFPALIVHLEEMLNDVLQNLDVFKKEESEPQPSFPMRRDPREGILKSYEVNLFVDNCTTQGAPVIFEYHPNYTNITGQVEYRAQLGVLSTDFTMIKPGSLHKANGGYLLVQAHEILQDYFAWDSLKKAILYNKVTIENVAQKYGYAPTMGLKPQPVPIKLKVVMIGDARYYHLLRAYDADFEKLFKVKADFDWTMPRTQQAIEHYASFIASKSREQQLLAFDRSAVARLIDCGVRISEHRNKLSARLLQIGDLVKEADFWARRQGSEIVSAAHVDLAIDKKIYRSNLVEQKLDELIEEGTIIIDSEGSQVGQINGLSVMQLGDYSFGRPSRITARTHIGKGHIINIERESEMSGNIHSKGVLILSGFLGSRYAQDKPLALAASICFEQLYDGVEGDSASSAELYVLLSSIGSIPLRQDLAVTGSVDQRGVVQPVGGVNQKIEGFFQVCKRRGLSGKQGVLIPQLNIHTLSLRREVVEAVGQGLFHIYPVVCIDQGMEILCGMAMGERDSAGRYAEGTVNYAVDRTLRDYNETLLRLEKRATTQP